MKLVLIFALGVMVGSFGMYKTLNVVKSTAIAIIDTTQKGIEVGTSIVDSGKKKLDTVKETVHKNKK
jgi:hypothetical protein